MPEGALVGAWIKSAHKLWIKRLRRTSTLAEYMQVSNYVLVSFNFLCYLFFQSSRCILSNLGFGR